MNPIALQKGDQERILALLILTLVLPWLPGFLPRSLSFMLSIFHLAWEKRIAWRALFRSLLAPLSFLTLSSLALFMGQHGNILDLFSKSLFACMLLLVMSRSLNSAQWMALGQTWKVDALVFTLILLARRWLELSAQLWSAMNLGWKMRSQLSGIRNSLNIVGWRVAGVYQLHDMRVVSMDLAWQARGLPPILSLPSASPIHFQWWMLLKYLGPPLLAYALTTLVLRA